MWPHQQHQWKPHTMQNYHHNSRFISMITRNNKKYISRYTYTQKYTLSHIHTHTHKHSSAHATLTSCNAKAIEILWNPLLQVPRKRKPILAHLLGRIAKYVEVYVYGYVGESVGSCIKQPATAYGTSVECNALITAKIDQASSTVPCFHQDLPPFLSHFLGI